MSGWIAVSEQMPPGHKTLLFRAENGDLHQGRMCYGMHAPWYCGHTETTFGNVISDKQTITHWMPIGDALDALGTI